MGTTGRRGDEVGHTSLNRLWTRQGPLPARSRPGLCKHAAAHSQGPAPRHARVRRGVAKAPQTPRESQPTPRVPPRSPSPGSPRRRRALGRGPAPVSPSAALAQRRSVPESARADTKHRGNQRGPGAMAQDTGCPREPHLQAAAVTRETGGRGGAGPSGEKNKRPVTALYLLLGLEDVAPEDVAGPVPGDVAEDLQVLRVVGHVEDPAGK